MPEPDVLVTKVTIPPVRSVLLQRPRLLAVLDQCRSFPLTLLSASAGFGKTTLLSAWACQRSSRVAWLTLDEQDNDPIRFWAYVIAALRHSGAPVGAATLSMLHSPQPPLLTGALTALINELAALAEDTTLILDDYHLLSEPAIHESLQFFLDHLPSCLHLLLASRADPPLPLARLRARGQLVEVREADLRLSDEEAGRFLTGVMDLPLTEEEIGRLEACTEGWVTGLQLAALSLRRHADVSAFIQAFTGSHRLVLDYVSEEILAPLPEAQQRFLLYTSVLERMNADLCQALTGEQASQQMLESLERAHLFLVPLDEERRWYRFHTLFREVLLARLQASQPEQAPRLHREAARWYQRQGWLHEAIPHALATQDFGFVAELIEGYAELLFLQGEMKTLLTWIKLLPQEVLRAHPRLATCYILAFHMLFPFSHQQHEERAYLQQLQEGVEILLQSKDQTTLPEAERDRLRNRIMLLKAWDQGTQALAEGNVEELSRLAEQMQHLSLDDDAVWSMHSAGGLAMALRLAGNFPPMVSLLQESRKMARMMRHPSQEVHILWGLIAALIALGQLRQAHEYCQELQGVIKRLGVPVPLAAYPDLFQAQLAYAWNQLERAQSAAQQAIEKTAPVQYMDILMGAYEVLVRTCLAQGDLDGAEQAIREMERVYQSAEIPLFRPWVESLWVQLWLAQGNVGKAADWAAHAPYLQEGLFASRESAYLALARVYLAGQRCADALRLLAALLSSAEQVARVGSIVSILALQVAALQASGAAQEALRVLLRLLTLAAPEGYRRVFLDAGAPMQQALQALIAREYVQKHAIAPALVAYAQTLLEAFSGEQRQGVTEKTIPVVSKALPQSSAQAAQPLLAPLTPREQEVLLLLAEGASNQEIARHLVVSLATAKKHVAGILSKLGAENRTQAIARARSLSLL